MRPPLTVVLINNSGGGIFSFLPIANDVDEDVFTQLWSTPQNVDLAGECSCSIHTLTKVIRRSWIHPKAWYVPTVDPIAAQQCVCGAVDRSSSAVTRVFCICRHVPRAWHCTSEGD